MSILENNQVTAMNRNVRFCLFKPLLALTLFFCTATVFAQLPKVGEIQLGAVVTKDIPLCTAAEVAKLEQGRDVTVGICAKLLPEYSLQHEQERYRILNSRNTFFGKAVYIDTYKGRIWKAHFVTGPKYYSKPISLDAYIVRLEKAITVGSYVKPTVKQTDYSCGGYDDPKLCMETIQHTWRSPIVKYAMYHSIKTDAGTLTVELLKKKISLLLSDFRLDVKSALQ